jgi:hexokinase
MLEKLQTSYFTLLLGLGGLVGGYLIGLYRARKCHRPLLLEEEEREEWDHTRSKKTVDHAKRLQILLDLEKAFRISKKDLEAMCDAFIRELELGLTRSWCDVDPSIQKTDPPLPYSSIPMLPSYVDRLPTGKESGVFLAVDFGGTHVRIIKVHIDDPDHPSLSMSAMNANHDYSCTSNSTRIKMIQSKMVIPEELKIGSGYALFNYIAQAVADFIQLHPIQGTTKTPVPLGFTFSFAVHQKNIDSGTIIGWNKDFKCDDIIGLDPVRLLQDAIDKTVRNCNILFIF